MEGEQSDFVGIEELVAARIPPRAPDSSFHPDNVDLSRITIWKKTYAISVLAGLMTDPQYYANGIRLDWLQRLVFAKSEGKRKPTSEEFSRALNIGLDRAKVLQLEDPSEDLFCDLIVTPQGNFRIFTGQWEEAGPCTQTLLDAFQSLPDGRLKRDVLASVSAVLRLSDELAERSGVRPLSDTGGITQGTMAVPNSERLKRLARRVRFSNTDLARLNIDKATLSPFTIEPHLFPYVSDREPGNTPLEFHPLINTSNGTVVASPANVSLAIRAVLISAAQQGGMERVLLRLLQEQQQKYSEASGFWSVPSLKLSEPDEQFLRVALGQFADGYFLQVIQVPVTFGGFPEKGFGSSAGPDEDVSNAVATYVHKFWRFLSGQADCRTSVTVVLMGGWGTPYSLSPPIDHVKEPHGWQFLYFSFADAFVLGACEDGKLSDILRILQQRDRLESEGYVFHNPNGLLNLFGYWKLTNGHLIPEHLSEIQPPCDLVIPTDALLKPRREAVMKVDRRVLPLPSDGYRTVQRIEWDEDDLKPIYGSISDLEKGRLLGAVVLEKHVWWVESVAEPGENREWRYRIWRAALEWLAAVGANIVAALPNAFLPGAARVQIAIPTNSAFEKIDHEACETVVLSETITASPPAGNDTSSVSIADTWLPFLRRPENDAEIELISAILEAFSIKTSAVPRSELAKHVLTACGSRDWRWIHARPAITPMDRLGGHGLVGSFHRVPFSAVALAKCGSIWGIRPRSDGLEINGEGECRDFLTRYRDHILEELIADIRKFSRRALVELAAKSYQSARLEQQRWRGTIRALRAIHGTTADANAFKRQNEINAVQRAAKTVCEIAACEGPEADGFNPGRPELEDLYAKALLLVRNGQLFAAIRGGVVKPNLRISPAGDLLSDRSVFEVTLKPGAEWFNTRTLDEAATAYDRDRQEDKAPTADEGMSWEDDLRCALEAEYGDSLEALLNLQYALIQVAEARHEGTFVLRRSELNCLLGENQLFPHGNHAPLLERLTLPRRRSWRDRASGLTESDIDLSRFDRRFSLINRPLLSLDDSADSLVLVAPIFVADATMYSLSGLRDGTLNNRFWVSEEARKYAGLRGKAAGEAFEEAVAERLRSMDMKAWVRCKLSWVLNRKVDNELGDVDILAVSRDRKRVWVIEAKNLRLCRTEAEVAARLSEYRGCMTLNRKGREEPDKMLRHIRRVQYLREHRSALCRRLELNEVPTVKGLLVVDSPQPMNFYMLERLEDADSVFLDTISSFDF